MIKRLIFYSKKFDRFREGKFSFGEYMELAVFLGNIRSTIDTKDYNNSGVIIVNFEDFIHLSLNLI